jgi:hypothetical protein
MSPIVGDFDGIAVKIKEAEHGNPHVHAWYQGAKVKIFIKSLDVEGTNELPPKQMKKLREWMHKTRSIF